jgi:hypothetical protein
MNEVQRAMNSRLIQLEADLAEVVRLTGGSLDDDAAIYHGSATGDQWQCHLPLNVANCWADLPWIARAVAYVMAYTKSQEAR